MTETTTRVVREIQKVSELSEEQIPRGCFPHVFPVNAQVYALNYALFRSPEASFTELPRVNGDNVVYNTQAERLLSLSTRTVIYKSDNPGPLIVYPSPDEIIARMVAYSEDSKIDLPQDQPTRDEDTRGNRTQKSPSRSQPNPDDIESLEAVSIAQAKTQRAPDIYEKLTGVPSMLLERPLPIPHHAPGLGVVAVCMTACSLLYGMYSPTTLVTFLKEFPELETLIGRDLALLLREVAAQSDPKSAAAERIMAQCFMGVLRKELEQPRECAQIFKQMMERAVKRKTAYEEYIRNEASGESRPVVDNPPEDTCLAKQQFALLCSILLDEPFMDRIIEANEPYLDRCSLFAPFFLMIRGLRPGLAVYIPPTWPFMLIRGTFLLTQSTSPLSMPHSLGRTPLTPFTNTSDPLANLELLRDLCTQIGFGPQLDVGRNARVLLQGSNTNALARYYAPPPDVRHMEVCVVRMPAIRKRTIVEEKPVVEQHDVQLQFDLHPPVVHHPEPAASSSGWVSWGCGLLRSAGSQLAPCLSLRDNICLYIFQVGSREEVLSITTESTEEPVTQTPEPDEADPEPPQEPDEYKGSMLLSASVYHTMILGLEGEATLTFIKMDETTGEIYPPEPKRPVQNTRLLPVDDEEEEEEEGTYEKEAPIVLPSLVQHLEYDKSWVGWSNTTYERVIRPGDMVLLPPGFTVRVTPTETDEEVSAFSMIKAGAAASSAAFPEFYPVGCETNQPIDPAFRSTLVRPFYPYRCPVPDGKGVEQLPQFLVDLIQTTSVVGCVDALFKLSVNAGAGELPTVQRLKFVLTDPLVTSKLTGVETIKEKPLELGWTSPIRSKLVTTRAEMLEEFRDLLLDKDLISDPEEVFEALSRTATIGARLEDIEEGWPGLNWLWRSLHAQLMSVTFMLFAKRSSDSFRSLSCSIVALEYSVDCFFKSPAASLLSQTRLPAELAAFVRSHFNVANPNGIGFAPMLIKAPKFRKKVIAQLAEYISDFKDDSTRMTNFKTMLHHGFLPSGPWVSAMRLGQLCPQGTVIPAKTFKKNLLLITSLSKEILVELLERPTETAAPSAADDTTKPAQLTSSQLEVCRLLLKRLEVLEQLGALLSVGDL